MPERRPQADIFQQGRAEIVGQASDVLHHHADILQHLAAFLLESGGSFRSWLAMDLSCNLRAVRDCPSSSWSSRDRRRRSVSWAVKICAVKDRNFLADCLRAASRFFVRLYPGH